MRIVKACCPGCGGEIEVFENHSFETCTHCGSKIILDWEGQVSLATYLDLGMTYLEALNPVEADKYFSKALERDPKNQHAWFWKGTTTALFGNPNEANRYLTKSNFTADEMTQYLTGLFKSIRWNSIRPIILKVCVARNWFWNFNTLLINAVLYAYPDSKNDMAYLLFEEAENAYSNNKEFALWAIEYSIKLSPGCYSVIDYLIHGNMLGMRCVKDLEDLYVQLSLEMGLKDSINEILRLYKELEKELLILEKAKVTGPVKKPSDTMIPIYKSNDWIDLSNWSSTRAIVTCTAKGDGVANMFITYTTQKERARFARAIRNRGDFFSPIEFEYMINKEIRHR